MYPNTLIIQFNDLDKYIDVLNNDQCFPTIDVDALLSVAFEIFLVNINTNIDNIIDHVMNCDILNDRIDIDDSSYVKLESTVYGILTIIQSKLKDIFTTEGFHYEYMCKRRNNIVLLRKHNCL